MGHAGGTLDVAALPGPAVDLLAPAVRAAGDEWPAIQRVAARLADVAMGGGQVYAFGAGHASAFAAELYSRAGGIGAFIAISLEDLRTTPRAARVQYADSEPERDADNGTALLELYSVGPRDALLIASQSGRNGASIEMGIQARLRGTYTVGIVSRAHCLNQPSRHPSGSRLLDVVDDVLDNHCPVGDAAVAVPGVGHVSAASTVSFALIAQLLNAEVIRCLVERGHAPKVIRSANVDVI